MKYKIYNNTIPQEKRNDINKKILYCIENSLCDKYRLTKNIIYNSYSGDGGLHELNYNDFKSFYDYTKAKREIENAQFFTHPTLSQYLIDIIKPTEHDTILTLTCGHGSMINFLPNEFNVYANEIDVKAFKVCKYLFPNANVTLGDMREYNTHVKVDFILDNPPFNLRMNYKGQEKYSQLVYIMKAQEILKSGGIMALIVPKSFLDDEFFNKSDIEYMNNNFNFICQIPLKNDAFKYLGVTDFSTKIIIFQKKSQFVTDRLYENKFINGTAEEIYNRYLKPIYNESSSNKSKIYLENLNTYDGDKEFEFAVKKLLCDIKRNKNVKQKYAECMNYLQQYYNQKKPDNMDYKEWQEVMLTKDKVSKKLKTILSEQHKKQVDEVKWVKTNYSIKLKGYSDKTKKYVENKTDKEYSINDLILNGCNGFEGNSLVSNNIRKLIERKRKEYLQQSKDFNIMSLDSNIDEWLSNSSVYNFDSEEELKLNNIQKEIVNKMLQKARGYIQSSQGTGKTLMSIFYALYRKQFNNTRITMVAAPSIAIYGTWEACLQSYKIPYIVLKNISDIKKINKGDFVLITFNMLIKLQKHIKKYLKQISNKYTLLVDEADSINRIDSKRSKVTLGTFKKAKYKLLLSGTMVRNNITESYTSFNLLYESSINFLSKNEYIYTEDKETKELKETLNNNYMKPFPEYKKGYELFRQSFNPSRISVFGIDANTQNIYNSEILKELINSTVITKTFEEVTKRKIYEIIQHTVNFNESERRLYNKAINEFYSMKYLFTSTGHPRKDRMMEIIQQITLLLNICQHPQAYKEYQSSEIPSKYKKVLSMVNKWNNERIAIGCRTLKEINCYAALIQKHFPNRRLFIITGNTTTMKQRKEIIAALKNTDNGILLSTQQSLSSSVNIGYINKIICVSLSWNWSVLSQWFFRFIRYDSTDNKEVHFITYENSLEMNLLSLIMAKENLALYMKNQELDDNDELYERFGVDFNLLDMLLTKDRDSEGKVRINWGEQNIV